MDAEDESLARWKASLGIVPGSSGPATGPKVCIIFYSLADVYLHTSKVTILSLELASPTMPPGKTLVMNLQDRAQIDSLKKNPINIKEGVEYK